MANISIPQLRDKLKSMVEPGVRVPSQVIPGSCTILYAPITIHQLPCTSCPDGHPAVDVRTKQEPQKLRPVPRADTGQGSTQEEY